MKNSFLKRELFSRLLIGLLIFAFQAYVIWIALYRYISFKNVAESEIFGDSWNLLPLHIYLYIIVIAFALNLLILFCSIRKTGNWANDGIIIGRKFHHIASILFEYEETLNDTSKHAHLSNSKCSSLTTYQASQPFNCFIYVFLAFILLLPLPWLNGESIRNGAIDHNLIWHTDLSFVFPPPSSFWDGNELREQLLSDAFNALKTLRSSVSETQNRSLDTIYLMGLQPLSLGGLGQIPQSHDQLQAANEFKRRFYQAMSSKSKGQDFVSPPPIILSRNDETNFSFSPQKYYFPWVSTEIINFLLAFLFLLIRLPQTYIYTSVKFASLSACLILLSGLSLILTHSTIGLLTQLSICLVEEQKEHSRFENPSLNLFDSDGITLRAFQLVRLPIYLKSWTLITLEAINFLITFVMMLVLNEFGVKQFVMSVKKHKNLILQAFKSPKESSNHFFPPFNQTGPASNLSLVNCNLGNCENLTYSNHKPMLNSMAVKPSKNCEKRKLPLIGFALHLLKMALAFPLFLEFMRMYWSRSDIQCLATLLISVLVDLFWLLTWCSLLLKPVWNFKLKLPANLLTETNSINGSILAMPTWKSPPSSIIQPTIIPHSTVDTSSLKRDMPLYSCFHGSTQNMNAGSPIINNIDNYVYLHRTPNTSIGTQHLNPAPLLNSYYVYSSVPISENQYNTLPITRSCTEYDGFNKIVSQRRNTNFLEEENYLPVKEMTSTFRNNTPNVLPRSMSIHKELTLKNGKSGLKISELGLQEAIYTQPKKNIDRTENFANISNGSEGSQSSHLPSQDSGVSIGLKINLSGGEGSGHSSEERVVVDDASFFQELNCRMVGADEEVIDIQNIPIMQKSSTYSFLKTFYPKNNSKIEEVTILDENKMCSQV